jgi:hypothetical protein
MDNQPEEKKEIPIPPSSKASIRTMETDIKSIQESGGQSPQPYLAEIDHQEKKEAPAEAEEISLQPPQLEPVIPGYTGPEEPIFQPNVPTPLPPLEKKQPPTAEISKPKISKPKGKGIKILLIISGILILGIILGLLGYYVIAPWVFSLKETASMPEEESVQKEEAVVPVPEIKPNQYLSLFKTFLSLREEIIISPLTLESFKNALTASANLVAEGNLKELIIRDNDRSLIGFPKLISLLLPELNREEIAGMFAENFTLVIFADQNGFWPGYIVQLKPTATIIGSQALVKEKIESSRYLDNLFLENPGSTAVAFKDGRTGSPTISIRYLVFPKTGAVLNYGWLNNNLIISTSYPGFTAILEKLR